MSNHALNMDDAMTVLICHKNIAILLADKSQRDFLYIYPWDNVPWVYIRSHVATSDHP